MTSVSRASVQMVQSSGCAGTGTAPQRKNASRERSVDGVLELLEDDMVLLCEGGSWELRSGCQ
jgi:hypothetical protein